MPESGRCPAAADVLAVREIAPTAAGCRRVEPESGRSCYPPIYDSGLMDTKPSTDARDAADSTSTDATSDAADTSDGAGEASDAVDAFEEAG